MNLSKTASAFYSITLLVLLVPSGYAQPSARSVDRPSSCEEIVRSLDIAAIEFNKLSNARKVIIVLAGSPSSKSPISDLRRVNQAIRYLSHTRGIRKENIIYGIGRASGFPLSYLEFYVGGILVSDVKTGTEGRLCGPLNESL